MPEPTTIDETPSLSPGTTLTVAEILATGRCSPRCLCAHGVRETTRCECPCGGRWHGALSSKVLPGSLPAPAPQDGQDLFTFLEMEII